MWHLKDLLFIIIIIIEYSQPWREVWLWHGASGLPTYKLHCSEEFSWWNLLLSIHWLCFYTLKINKTYMWDSFGCSSIFTANSVVKNRRPQLQKPAGSHSSYLVLRGQTLTLECIPEGLWVFSQCPVRAADFTISSTTLTDITLFSWQQPKRIYCGLQVFCQFKCLNKTWSVRRNLLLLSEVQKSH